MMHVYPLVAVLLTLLTSGLTDASILCSWTKVLTNGELHHSFLRSDAASLRLYHSIRSDSLQSCSFSDNKEIIQNYMTLCQENKEAFSHHLDLSSEHAFDEHCTCLDSPQTVALEKRSFLRRRVRSAARDDERSEVKSKLRVKRGFIVPGTLWCGSGNKAPSYSDLGVFSETDTCCREHDQCKDTILSFHSKFGVFNRNIFTMSHCDCDNRLQCTERNWFGMCQETNMALYAEVHSPTLYATDAPKYVNGTSLNITSPSAHNITQVEMSESDGSKLQTLSIPPSSRDAPVRASLLPTRSRNQSLPLPDAYITEKQDSCAVYKYLDECRNRILPLQRKYGFLNNESRTMYHCNCTSRLFQSLAAQPVLTGVRPLLLDYVSQSCFVHECTAAQICRVAVVGAQLSQVEARSSALMEEQRHLQAMRLNIRRPNHKRATKERPARLYRLCRRIMLLNSHKQRHHIKETIRKKPE
uniref:Phospholipase A2-like central domain-containing protein n=1 Tax=Knipowitschia caucasica TaxID=637954 RepID=A0AAV2IW49_KNICA